MSMMLEAELAPCGSICDTASVTIAGIKSPSFDLHSHRFNSHFVLRVITIGGLVA